MIHPAIYIERILLSMRWRWQLALVYWAFIVFLPIHLLLEVLRELREEEEVK